MLKTELNKTMSKVGSKARTMNKGFSLIELLVTITILSILSFLGIKTYQNMREASNETWTKAEMAEVAKFLKTAKSTDKYYHQFIYKTGYRPQGKVYATVGTAASEATVCCDKYPNVSDNPCEKNYSSGWLYYDCKDNHPYTATDNIEICNSSGYSFKCDPESNLSALKASDFSTCSIAPSSWCDCYNFVVGARLFSGGKMTLNQTGDLCIE